MCYGKQGEFVLWKKSGILGYQILEYLAMINTSIMAPSTCIRISSLFKKYASTRSIFKSFSPVHTKKLKRWKYKSIRRAPYPFRSMRHARSIMMYDINTFENLHFCLSTRKREASVFKNPTLESVFEKMCFRWLF